MADRQLNTAACGCEHTLAAEPTVDSVILLYCRNVHTRLRTHAESIAFFGGGPREGRTVAAYFDRLTQHLLHVANIKWLHSVADDFFTKQLPFNVTWVLTLMYAVDQGEVANDPVAQVAVYYPLMSVYHSLLLVY